MRAAATRYSVSSYVHEVWSKGNQYFYFRPPKHLRDEIPPRRLYAATLEEAKAEAAALIGPEVPAAFVDKVITEARALIDTAMPGNGETRVVWAEQFDRLAEALDRLGSPK